MSFSFKSILSQVQKNKLFKRLHWQRALPFVTVVIVVIVYFLSQNVQTPPEHVADPFERGEYYFNAYNSPDGEYDLKLARQYYTQAIEEGSEEQTVWYQLGRIDFLEGNYNAALYKFEKQISLHGDAIPNVYYMKGLTHGYKARREGVEDDWKKAEENFQKFLAYDLESPWTRTDLAWVYFSQGKFTEMLSLLEDGLSYEPYNPWLLNMYGLALLNTGSKKEAHEQFLLAKEYVGYLSPEDWGRTYPGNDPSTWVQGLAEFQSLIQKNLDLTSK